MTQKEMTDLFSFDGIQSKAAVFDTTKLEQPMITVLPPVPPERGEDPRRIVINVEIVERHVAVGERLVEQLEVHGAVR